jgi:hypothetical protein
MRIPSGDHQDLDEIGAIPAWRAAAFGFAFGSSLAALVSILAMGDMEWEREQERGGDEGRSQKKCAAVKSGRLHS